VPSGGEVEEFSRLGNALQRAIDRSEETFERQAQFIGDASHELQTPLAVIGNRVEWLLDNPALTEEQAAELFKIEKTLSHAVRLNKTLLLLTKIDNHQFPESTDVNMVELIEECVENYGEVYSSRSVDFSCNLPASYTLHINPSLAATMVNNLVKNAYVHSQEGAVAEVTLQGDELVVSNTGEAALDADHIFDSFYQGQRKSGSTGLGLALVAAVCRYYNMGITYRFEGGRHNFCVKLK
jgi:signal transduction histidine kinase